MKEGIKLIDLQLMTYDHWINEGYKYRSEYKILYGKIDFVKEVKNETNDYPFEYDENAINNIWFKYFICIKKIARKDHLVGLHLLMDLIKEYLVLKMIERDVNLGTHIHRHGTKERLPNNIAFDQINCSDSLSILNYINQLAREYDTLLSEKHVEYQKHYDFINNYIQQTIKQLEC